MSKQRQCQRCGVIVFANYCNCRDRDGVPAGYSRQIECPIGGEEHPPQVQKSTWGDAFEQLVPGWIPKPEGCSCKDTRMLMNTYDSHSANRSFENIVKSIVRNAKKSILRPIPASLLESAIRRRMKKAYNQAFGIDLD